MKFRRIISSPERMRQFDKGRQNFIAGRKSQLEQWKIQSKALDPNSEQAQRLREIISTNPIMLEDLENNYILTLPTFTFNDRMTLDLGDITLKLVHFGQGRHTGDDIIIHCPEEKLLFTGDLFYRGSMGIAFSAQFDAPRWIEVMNDLLEDESDIEWVYDTHNGRMPVKFISLWRDYLVELWEGLNTAKNEGFVFEDTQERFSYDKKFTHLEQSGLEKEQPLKNTWKHAPKKSHHTILMRLNLIDWATGCSAEKESQRPSKCSSLISKCILTHGMSMTAWVRLTWKTGRMI